MKKTALFLLFWLCCMAAPAWAEAPLGDWFCVGQNPGDKRQYKGQVSVIKSGETYTVMWRFGNSTYIGTGIEQQGAFAVAFTQNQMTPQPNPVVGLALFRRQGENWEGQWTQMGSQSLGRETWTRMGNAPAPPPR